MIYNKDFYRKGIDLQKASLLVDDLISNYTLKEILWAVSNICYDQISYYDDRHYGRIYENKEAYSTQNREQATRLQRQISTYIDLFSQSIIDKRVFPEEYLSNYDYAGYYIKRLKEKEQLLSELQEQVNTLQDMFH